MNVTTLVVGAVSGFSMSPLVVGSVSGFIMSPWLLGVFLDLLCPLGCSGCFWI